LEAIVADRNRAQKHVARARIILHSAERLAVAEVARRAGVGRPAVWRWQRRFVEGGVGGLLRDASRKPGKKQEAMVEGARNHLYRTFMAWVWPYRSIYKQRQACSLG
jgi:transposase